ncbi:glycosyltransferase family 2 protein [Halobacterium litoreum]|uniref:Glycosyltransferase family 2 protein n=1 Tax=Halobacterium litoreum TaxID=2039234 RepID=A0ABD5NG43_9EURY|nr:glycosyltransferase family 2 protein [Halobacterium litoreum]UHH12887.1 glycosyltransferase family 2 protein [Halobacterium litoreum]
MRLERPALLAAAGALLVAVPGVFLGVSLGLPVGAQTVFELTLWAATLLFAGTAVVWFGLTYVVGAGYETPDGVHGGDDVQVRILTIDSAAVVQQTVDSLPDELDDVHVVAEDAIDVAGASVHVVPDDFECDAVRKGRAIEWARRTLDCDREFVLYLDEDSVVESFEGLPDADVVQLREQPRQTGSVLSYLADVYRMGVQLEQRAFARLSIPLFAWGGGIAVRRSVEDEVTWNRETLVEDTAFVWSAARRFDLDFELGRVTCRNEAPPNLYEILQQRRRWAAGNVRAADLLPVRYRVLTRVRNYAWALSPVVTLVAVPLSLLGVTVVHGGLFAAASAVLALFTAYWYLRGVSYYGSSALHWALAVPLAPLVTVVHSMGTVAGILSPPAEFRVTTKAGGK